MRTNEIQKMIQKAIDDEERNGRLRVTILQNARQHGLEPPEQAVEDVVMWVREYVEHVPAFLREGERAAQRVGLNAQMGQMLQELESYWFEVHDLVPDHLGLMGLMDDAYATLLLLQAISDYCLAAVGRPLLSQNLTAANQGMRGLLAGPIATTIEQRVGMTLGNALFQNALGAIGTSGFAFSSGADPIWGNASIDEIVNARLGALGVV